MHTTCQADCQPLLKRKVPSVEMIFPVADACLTRDMWLGRLALLEAERNAANELTKTQRREHELDTKGMRHLVFGTV
jgi:hypothetical protein